MKQVRLPDSLAQQNPVRAGRGFASVLAILADPLEAISEIGLVRNYACE
jgi:hypothetical protein